MGKLTPDTILREEGLETLSLVPDFMTFPIFLLLWGLLPCIQGACELKDNAVDLLSVDYAGFLEDKSDVTAYVDEISVKMKGGERWSSLLKDTSRASGCNVRRLKTNVYYKKKTDEEWERLGRKRMSSSDDFEIRHLNPCETYQVKVTALTPEVTVGILEVGPYYRRDFQQEYLIDMDNEYYLTYADFPFYYINATGFEGSATISLANLCARTVAVHVYKGDINHGIEKIIDTDPETKQKQSIIMEELEHCTQYHVALDLFLKKHLAENLNEKEDFLVQDIVSFYTMPDSNLLTTDLYLNYNEDDNLLTWDFKEFFTQDCADDDSLVSMEFILDIGGDITSVSMEGSQVLPIQECDFNVVLTVKYGKGEWKQEVNAFKSTISGFNTVGDTLTLESGNIVKTVNPCQEGHMEVTVDGVPLPGDVASPQPVSEMEWQGCSDHKVTMWRGGYIASEMVIPHPGWNNVLTVLEEVNKTDTNITFKQPEEKCDVNKFKIEIVCEAIEGEDEATEENVSEMESPEEKVSEEVSEGEVFKGEAFEETVPDVGASEEEASELEGFEEEASEAEMSDEEVSNENDVESNEDETIESGEPSNEIDLSNEVDEVTNESEDETNEKDEAINENVEDTIESDEPINETEQVIKETNEVSDEFKFEDILQMKNLSPETRYECKGRLVNIDNEEASEWSEPVRVKTDKEEVIEEEILEETEANISTDSEAFGSDENDIVEAIVNPVVDPAVEPVVDVDEEPTDDGVSQLDAAAISNAPVVDSKETEGDAISEEFREEMQEPVEPRKAGASGLIIGLIVCGLLSVLLVAMVVTWRKRSNVKNHQLEEALPENSPDDCVKVEINDSMTNEESTEIITHPTETPQNDENEMNDQIEEVKITMESSGNEEVNSAVPTNTVDEISPAPSVETPVAGDVESGGGDPSTDKE